MGAKTDPVCQRHELLADNNEKEKEIDRLVYNLYVSKEEEIEVLEETA